MTGVAQDLRLVFRAWRRRPALNAVIVATLALGICATTAVFSVVNAVLLQPLPYAAPERLAVVRGELPAQGQRSAQLSGPEVVALAERSGPLSSLGGVWARPGVWRGADRVSHEEIEVGLMTPGFLETLGVAPLAGRLPTPAEEATSSPDVIVLSHAFWQRRYGGDASIVGRRIEFDEEPRTVIGVMPSSFRMLFPDEEGVPESVDAWLPWGSSLRELPNAFRVFTVVARRADGTSWAEVNADLQATAVTIAGTSVEYARSGFGLRAAPLADAVVAEVRPTLLVLLGVVGFVLLIACANVANLLMARSADQSRELTVRAALGAGRGRLWRQLLTESAVIGVAGGSVGVVLARSGVHLLRLLDPDGLPRLSDVAVDASTLGFAAVVTLVTALLFGAAVATHALAAATTGSLHGAPRGESIRSHATRRMLVVGQVSMSLVLLAGAGLLLRSFVRLNTVDLGFEPAGVVSIRLSLPDVRYPYPTGGIAIGEFYRRLDDLVAEIPGVLAVGATLNPPLSELPMRPRPYAYRSAGTEIEWGVLAADYRTVTPGWFRAVGARITAGRPLDTRDRWDRPLSVVVDTALARKAWPDQDPVGQAIRVELFRAGVFGPNWAEVVGVIEPVRLNSLVAVEREQIYLAHHQAPQRTMYPAIKTAGDPLAVLPAVQAAVDSLEKDLPIFDVRLAAGHVSLAMAHTRFALISLGIFASAALALAAAGVYAAMAFTVAQRRREIGIRLAIGGAPRSIVHLVLGQGLALTAAGVLAGLVGALALTRLLGGLLYGVTPTDPATLFVVATVLVTVGTAACWLPARRAAKVDLLETLRTN